MSSSNDVFHATCACGRTELHAQGVPMFTIACYCDDCQAAGKQIDAMAHASQGHGGMAADGGTVSTLFRKDRVHCVRGGELLTDHKLKATSATTRGVASCCNSNMFTRFDNWMPFVALRTYAQPNDVVPELCISTRFAPDLKLISHHVPHHAGVPLALLFKVIGNATQLGFQRGTPTLSEPALGR